MGNKRINWLLILQGWAMLWVVIGHSYLGNFLAGPVWENILCKFAYSFHMPLFMFVSGYLFYLTRLNKKYTYNEIIKDKALRLLLPGLFFSIVALILKILFSGEMSRQIGISLQEIVHAYLYPYDNPMRELWFIATLFWLMLLTPLWQLFLNEKHLIWIGVLVLSLIHFWHLEVGLLCIGKVFQHGIWFYLGLVISKEKIIEKYLIKVPWKLLFFGIIIYLLGNYICAFITTVGGIIFSIGLALVLDKYIPMMFFSFRNYTYQIFLMGIFVQVFVKIIYRYIDMPYMVGYFLCILMGLYVPVLISKLVEKIDLVPISRCFGLKSVKK